MERTLSVEYRSYCLSSNNSTCREAAAVSDPIDLIPDRFVGVPFPDEIGPDRMGRRSVGDRRRSRTQGLRDDLATVEATPGVPGSGTDEGVGTVGFELEHEGGEYGSDHDSRNDPL